MDAAAFELMHDLGRGEEHDLDAGKALERAAIATLMAGLAQSEAGMREAFGRLVLEPPLGGNGDAETSLGHQRAPPTAASRRSVWMAEPMAGTSRGAPSRVSRPS